MNCATIAFVVAALIAVATADISVPAPPPVTTSPSKPEWANQFDAAFGLNVEKFHYDNRSSHMYYDWDIKATHITYQEGCLPVITTKPCDLIFNPQGTWLLAPKAGKDCCLLFKGIGSVPPNFLKPFNFSGVENATDMFGNSHITDKWVGPMGFKYWTDTKTGLDIRFEDGGTGVFWNYGNINFRKQNATFFNTPGSNVCKASCFLEDGNEDAELQENLKNLKPEHIKMSLPQM